ncbi:MAG: hypothetical protein ACD_20C00435G0015 [uncultured bacterium]|nr:MAG: hypothetical protein ACD_20C00435G0015 [uncultured bacterium]
MNEKFQELKRIYEGIHNNTSEISSLISKGDFNNIQDILDQRGAFIKKVEEINTCMDFSDEEKKEINELLAEIKLIEKNNLEQMEKRKEYIQQELSQINISSKAITAYKYEKQVDPRIIDSKE